MLTSTLGLLLQFLATEPLGDKCDTKMEIGCFNAHLYTRCINSRDKYDTKIEVTGPTGRVTL